MPREYIFPPGHPKFGYLSCDDDRWPKWKLDAEKYWDELRKSGGYDVKSPYGRVDLRSHGVEPLLEGEMDDTESTEIANFAITQHKKELPLEEHHSLLRVEWVTVVRYLYYKYYFTMMVKDSSGKDHSCRAKIVICPEGCKFLIEYGLGPFAEFTTLPPEYDYECTFSSIPISNERKPEFLMMQSYTNGDVYMEEAQESSDEDMEEAQETNGRMTVYKFEHCIHLQDYPVIT